MNCLDRVTIQEYIDKELDAVQMRKIESHLRECDLCSHLYREANIDKSEVNQFISPLYRDEDDHTIPNFDFNHRRKRSFLYSITSSLPLKVAAGIAFLIGLFFIMRTNVPTHDVASEDADLLILELIGNTEPNKAWHHGQMVIVLVDENGEVIQSFLSE
jgi:predicted anti-sigma-YlaC factor YlaD